MEPSKKVDEELKDRGYERSQDKDDEYTRQKEKGGYERVRTDGDWIQEDGSASWTKIG